jgi:hypothetical protein
MLSTSKSTARFNGSLRTSRKKPQSRQCRCRPKTNLSISTKAASQVTESADEAWSRSSASDSLVTFTPAYQAN